MIPKGIAVVCRDSHPSVCTLAMAGLAVAARPVFVRSLTSSHLQSSTTRSLRVAQNQKSMYQHQPLSLTLNPSNFCRPDKCCIRCMQSRVPSYLINEQENGSNFMIHNKWNFGGRMDCQSRSDRIALVDMVPVLLPKKDSESEMIKQYMDVDRLIDAGN